MFREIQGEKAKNCAEVVGVSGAMSKPDDIMIALLGWAEKNNYVVFLIDRRWRLRACLNSQYGVQVENFDIMRTKFYQITDKYKLLRLQVRKIYYQLIP